MWGSGRIAYGNVFNGVAKFIGNQGQVVALERGGGQGADRNSESTMQ